MNPRLPQPQIRAQGEVILPDDPRHPANDPNHPQHEQAKAKLAALKSKENPSGERIPH